MPPRAYHLACPAHVRIIDSACAGGAAAEPLRCETSPVEFSAFRVGLALAGRDTGSSQLFVTLGSLPHLDGDYPLLGSTQPGWSALAAGDLIRKVQVLE